MHNDRLSAAKALVSYMRGESNNFELDEVFFGYSGKDESICKISVALWLTYDDVKQHGVSVPPETWKAYRRCVAFLQTDLEIPKEVDDASAWPLANIRQLIASRPDIRPMRIPRYDPAQHGRPFRSSSEYWLSLSLSCLGILSLLVCLAKALFHWLS